MSLITTNIPLLFSIIAFVVFCLFFIGLYQFLQARSRKEMIKAKIRQEHAQPSFSSITKGNQDQRTIFRLFNAIGSRAAPQKQEGAAARVKYIRAGIRDPHAPGIFWGAKILLMLLSVVAFFLVRITLVEQFSTQYTMIIGLLIAAAGFYLPDIWLGIKTAERKRRIFEGFPDALDLLVVCVEAGMGLDAAISRVGEEIKLSNKVLGEEFKIVTMEIRAGKSREEALRSLGTRANLEDVKGLATLLIQTERFGTSIAQALRVYADTFRTKRFQRAEEIAAKLPVKLLFPLIFFIFPALFVVLAGPIVIQFIKVLLPTLGGD